MIAGRELSHTIPNSPPVPNGLLQNLYDLSLQMRLQLVQLRCSNHLDRSCKQTEACPRRVKRIGVGFFVFESIFETKDLDMVRSITLAIANAI